MFFKKERSRSRCSWLWFIYMDTVHAIFSQTLAKKQDHHGFKFVSPPLSSAANKDKFIIMVDCAAAAAADEMLNELGPIDDRQSV